MKKLFALCLLALPVVAEKMDEQIKDIQEFLQENSVQNLQTLPEVQKEENVETKPFSAEEQLTVIPVKEELKQNLFEELPQYSLVRIQAEDVRARDKKTAEIVGFVKKTNSNTLVAVVGKAINGLNNMMYDGAKEKVDLLEKILYCAAHDKERVNNDEFNAYCKECLNSETVEEMARKISLSLLKNERPENAIKEMEIVRKTVERLKARN